MRGWSRWGAGAIGEGFFSTAQAGEAGIQLLDPAGTLPAKSREGGGHKRVTHYQAATAATVRYEDFLDYQERVLRAICEFAGISHADGMLDISRSGEARQIAGISALWESNYSAPIKANADKFKQVLSMEDIEIIETSAGELMRYYGYEPMTPGRAILSEREIAARRAASQARRAAAWTKLRETKYPDYWLRRFRADYLAGVRERLRRNPASA